MDKKPLIMVSICAVVLLVMASLTNVVGYQSVSSTTVNDSPLFTTRTQRATNQQQNILTSQYLGMGKGNLLRFPIRDNKTESFVKAIEYISKMDDKTFAFLTELCIQQTRKDKTLSEANPNEIIKMLTKLRTDPEIIIKYHISRNYQNITVSDSPSICQWFPGCISLYIIIPIITIIVLLMLVFLPRTSVCSIMVTCQGSTFCYGNRCL